VISKGLDQRRFVDFDQKMQLKSPGGQARLMFATIASVLLSLFTARALDLLELADNDRRYVFGVASAAPVPV
jgi:hypothetical protein